VRLVALTVADAKTEEPKSIAVNILNDANPGPRSVMLVVVMKPRKLFLQPGTSLAPLFDEPTSSGICANTVAPQMRAGKFKAAIEAGFEAIVKRLAARCRRRRSATR